jgi:hypothetical protein
MRGRGKRLPISPEERFHLESSKNSAPTDTEKVPINKLGRRVKF